MFNKRILFMNMDEKIMENFIEDSFDFKKIKKGNTIKGEIVCVLKDEIVVNIKYFCDGIVKKDELLYEISNNVYLKGSEIDVYVLSLDDGFGNVLLSEKRAHYENAIKELKNIFKQKRKVYVFVKESVDAGLICEFKGVSGFIPRSMVSTSKVNLNDYVNKNLEVVLIEFNQSRGRVIFSSKEIEIEKKEMSRRKFLNEINVGDKFLGKVLTIKDFGIFVEVDGVQGFVHKFEITHKKNFNINDEVSVGDEVTLFVLKIDKENCKVSFTMKDSNYSSFDKYKNDFIVGSVYEGVISKILPFGMVVDLNDEISGFIHISEFPDEFNNLIKCFKVMEKIKVKILSFDVKSEKISLSYSKVFEDEGDTSYSDEDISSIKLGDLFKDVFSKIK